MVRSTQTGWVEQLADAAVLAVCATASYVQRKRCLEHLLTGMSRDEVALEDAAFLCRQRARRRAQPPQTEAEAASASQAQQAAAALLEAVSLDLRLDVI